MGSGGPFFCVCGEHSDLDVRKEKLGRQPRTLPAQHGHQHDAQSCTRQAGTPLLAVLRQHDWVVYAKEPLGGPAQVLDYLGRYTHKTAISNERIVAVRGGQVLFRVRDREHAGKKRIESLTVDSFISRFMSHVLRIRHYGVLPNCHKREQAARCQTALGHRLPDKLKWS